MLKIKVILLLLIIVGLNSCNQKGEHSTALNLIPYPVKVMEQSGSFELNASTKIIATGDASQLVANYLQGLLHGATAFDLPIENKKTSNSITLELVKGMADEAYELSVQPQEIIIKASQSAGLFYGVQTLRQLLPTEIESSKVVNNITWKVSCVEIKDEPRFNYRGMHLDVARHFFPVKFVKKYIDMLALHKMNRFHWHLTEDQGWRIEIKKYPKLQEIAAFRKETIIGHNNNPPARFDGKRYGGFYTQDEIKEVVAYAKARFITIIPEIEMPGHAMAAISAYPELSCTGDPIEAATRWGVFKTVFCPKEETFEFLENVLLEVFELFPSEYIHIGGDECPKDDWKASEFCQDLIKKEGLKDEHELQSYFIKRMEKFINSHDRQIIGWDEILEGGLAPNATVMSWRGINGGIAAARQGHDVIMTPNSHAYFDYYQSRSKSEPLAIGGFLSLEKVYSYEPIPSDSLTKDQEKHILGAQGNLWTEYITTPNVAEYMAFPRALAFAEVNWSPKSARDYDNFTTRLGAHFKRLDAMGVNYAKHIFDVTANLSRNEEGKLQVDLNSKNQQGKIHFTTDGDIPTPDAPIYEKPILLGESNKVYAALFENNNPTANSLGNMLKADFVTHKAAIRKITTNFPASKSFGKGDSTLLVNGVLGNQSRFNDGQWLGWQGKNLEAVVDLGALTPIESITLRFFKSEHQWIYYPKKATISFSHDNETFVKVGEYSNFTGQKDKVLDVIYDLKTNVQYIKVSIDHYGIIPEGRRGGGENAWFFMDEIVVQ